MKCLNVICGFFLAVVFLFAIENNGDGDISFSAEGFLHNEIFNIFSKDGNSQDAPITINSTGLKYITTKKLNDQINLKYPSLWKSNITESENTFEIKQKDMNLLITLRNTTSDSLDELTFKQKNILRQEFPGIKNANSTKLKTDNFLGYKYTFDIDELKVMRIWTMNGDKDLLITFISTKNGFDAYYPIIKKIINSIEFNF